MPDGRGFYDKRQTVTLIVRKANGRDAYGNVTYDDQEVVVGNCLVAPTGGQETTDNADRVVDSASVYNLDGTWPDDHFVNRVRLNDGSLWEIDGAPQRWPGKIGGVAIQLRKVRG